MASSRLFALILAFLVSTSIVSALPDGRNHGNQMPKPVIPNIRVSGEPVTDRNGTQLPPLNTTYYFDQLIDHKNPGLGTFKQRYWHTWEWWQHGMTRLHCILSTNSLMLGFVGGPIIIMTPGEGNAQGFLGYLTNRTINGQIAQQQNGATIVIEHRFYGESNPYNDLSVKSLQVHTIQQAIDDLVYFAKNVKLAMPGGDNVTPDKAPWILIGGSYAGALTGWTMTK
jgi:hypothetical protein